MMNDMKAVGRIVIALIGMLCFVCASCSKVDENPHGESIWSGAYPIQTLNGTTGELEDQTGVIILVFHHGGNQCDVSFGIAGLYGMTWKNYAVRWSDNTAFALYTSSGTQSLVCYSGTISVDTMTLKAYNCDSVAATYELSRRALLLEE